MTILEQRTMNAICDIARSLRTISECMMKHTIAEYVEKAEKVSKEAEAFNRQNEAKDEEK